VSRITDSDLARVMGGIECPRDPALADRWVDICRERLVAEFGADAVEFEELCGSSRFFDAAQAQSFRESAKRSRS